MSNVRTVHNAENPFVQISRDTLAIKGLSFNAKGFLGYILSKPPTWITKVSQVSREYDISERSIYKMINELIKFDLCKKERGRKIGPSGRMVYDRVGYVFLEVPCDDETFKEKFQQCDSELLQNVKVQTNRNQDEIQAGHYNITIISKKEGADAPTTSTKPSPKCRTKAVQSGPPKKIPTKITYDVGTATMTIPPAVLEKLKKNHPNKDVEAEIPALEVRWMNTENRPKDFVSAFNNWMKRAPTRTGPVQVKNLRPEGQPPPEWLVSGCASWQEQDKENRLKARGGNP